MKTSTDINIRILPARLTDRKQWDACVTGDTRGLIYSTSAYLDQMAGDWYGLVVNDYEAVLALPVKKIAGLKMIYTPPFFQRLDLTGTYRKTDLTAIREKVLAFAPLLDCHTTDPGFPTQQPVRKKTHYMLHLNKPYDKIGEAYTKECKKNIGKAIQRNCIFRPDVTIREVISFYQKAYGAKAAYREKHFVRLIDFAEHHESHSYIHLMGVADDTTGSLIFAAALLDDGKRLYYLLGAPSEEGRKARATAFFIDQTIRQFAGKREIFDFEGSDIPAVASFYRGFSPETEHYYRHYMNRLPQPLRRIADKLLQ